MDYPLLLTVAVTDVNWTLTPESFTQNFERGDLTFCSNLILCLDRWLYGRLQCVNLLLPWQCQIWATCSFIHCRWHIKETLIGRIFIYLHFLFYLWINPRKKHLETAIDLQKGVCVCVCVCMCVCNSTTCTDVWVKSIEKPCLWSSSGFIYLLGSSPRLMSLAGRQAEASQDVVAGFKWKPTILIFFRCNGTTFRSQIKWGYLFSRAVL